MPQITTTTDQSPVDHFLASTFEGQQISAHLSGLRQFMHDIQNMNPADILNSLEHIHGKFALDNHLEVSFRAIHTDREYAAAVVEYLSACSSRLNSLAHKLASRTDFRVDSFVQAFNDTGWTISSILATGSLQLVSTYGYIPRDITAAQLEAENPLITEAL